MVGSWLVADIGGTNLRVASMTPDYAVQQVTHLRCADYPTIEAALDDYFQQLKTMPRAGCLAVAGPVTGDLFKFTNNPWQFSASEVGKRFGLNPFLVINDFEALAYALPHLSADQLHVVGSPRAQENHNKLVIGPGTGLGVAGLVHRHGSWIPVPGEGGHISFAPNTDREAAILRVLWQKQGGRVSAERILSGMGLRNLYEAITTLEKQPAANLTAADIAERALTHACPWCVESLSIFCAALGSFAGDLALLFMAEGGVYIGGGIAPKILSFLEKSLFRQRFEDKGRHSAYLTQIATHIITGPHAALIGAGACMISNELSRKSA